MGARIPGPVGGTQAEAPVEGGTLPRHRPPHPGPVGMDPPPAFARRRTGRRRGPPRPPVPPGDPIVMVGLSFIIISQTHVALPAQVDVANQVFLPCRVQFHVEDTYDADPFMVNFLFGRRFTVDTYWRREDDFSEPIGVRLARDFASMRGHIKVFFVRDTGWFVAVSIPPTLDARHGSLGLRAYVSDGALPDTLAHELGHILLDDLDASAHVADPANLMCDGVHRRGRQLLPDQVRRIHGNADAIVRGVALPFPLAEGRTR